MDSETNAVLLLYRQIDRGISLKTVSLFHYLFVTTRFLFLYFVYQLRPEMKGRH